MNKIRCATLLTLITAIACSDDGAPGQGQNETGTTGAGSLTAPTDGEPTSAGDTTGNESVGGSTGDTGDGGTGSTGEVATTGIDTDPTSTGTGTDTGTGTSTGTDTDSCQPITEDASAIGVDCRNDGDCPPEYTCQPFIGVAFQQTCQILCEEDCECPMGLTCTFTEDKMGSWFQCT